MRNFVVAAVIGLSVIAGQAVAADTAQVASNPAASVRVDGAQGSLQSGDRVGAAQGQSNQFYGMDNTSLLFLGAAGVGIIVAVIEFDKKTSP
jgi:hypothetical protein